MPTITPQEARDRFGEIEHRATQTYREFSDDEGGIWRPVLIDGKLESYRLYRLHRIARKVSRRGPASKERSGRDGGGRA